MAIVFAVRGDYIQLDQLLKACGLVITGAKRIRWSTPGR